MGEPVTGYAPGSWVAMTGRCGWMLADIAPDGPVGARCWPLIHGGAGLAEVVEALLSDGLRSVDGFALAYHLAGEWQLIVRGKATAMVVTDTGSAEQVSADGVATWVERRFVSTAEIRLSGAAGSVGARRLPLVAGVVLADDVMIRCTATDSPQAEQPQPEPASPNGFEVTGETESLAHLRAGFAVHSDATEPRSFDHLFGATQRPPEPRPPEPRQPAPPAVPAGPPPTAVVPAGGLIDSVPWAVPDSQSRPEPVASQGIAKTVNRAALLAGSAGPVVHAVQCLERHLNPPHASTCRVCGAAIDGNAPVTVPRPALGVLRLSTGDLITLDRGVIMGRAPASTDGTDSDRPHIVRLASPGGDISRSHLHVTLTDWTVLVTDLGSTNGTVVTAPGQPPLRLRPHEAQAIEPGTVVSLADEISFRFEVS